MYQSSARGRKNAQAVVRAVAGFAAATLEPAIMQRHIPKYKFNNGCFTPGEQSQACSDRAVRISLIAEDGARGCLP